MSKQPSVWQNRILSYGEEAPDQLLANPSNWRIHPGTQQDALLGVLNDVGIVQDVIVSRNSGFIVDGHLRVMLAMRTNQPTIPVKYVDLTPDEEKLILATLDPLSALASTDKQKLDDLLRELSTTDSAVQQMLDDLALSAGIVPGLSTPGNGGDEFDTTPADGPTRTQVGQLWALGDHRLYVGDCTIAENVARLMEGQSIDLCFTSPPYSDQREYKIGAFDWHLLMCGAFLQIITHTSSDCHILVNLGLCHKDRKVELYWNQWLVECSERGWPLFGWYVWDKGSGMPGDHHGRLARAHEFLFHFNNNAGVINKWEKTHPAPPRKTNSKRFRQSDGSLKPATSPDKIGQSFKVPDSVIRIVSEKTNGIHSEHPAVYPVALPSFGIETWSMLGDIVYDPFLGSGTTLIAAERTGRICYGCEIAPVYADVILRRFEAETQIAPVLIDDNHSQLS